MKKAILGLLAFCCMTLCTWAQAPNAEGLWQQFLTPPDEARTKLWWFHGETPTTREGITADLEAFREAGVGGVVYYDQVHGTAADALEAFSPEWWQMFVFAAQEAKRLGLTFETHISNGYVAGGPWITPDMGMQMLVSADTLVEGGKPFLGPLPTIPAQHGYLQDVAVLAFPVPASDWHSLPPISPNNYLTFAADTVRYLNFDCQAPFTARSLSYRSGKRGKATTSATNVPGPPANHFVGTGYEILPDMGDLEASDDGINYCRVCTVPPIYNAHGSWNRKTISFPPVTARYFRLRLHDWWTSSDKQKPLRISDICLSSKARVMRWEEKAGLVSEYIDSTMNTSAYASAECISSDDIIDLTPHFLSPQHSTTHYVLPPGRWVVMRFAHVPTGAKTKHGRRNLIGLECDKLSRRAAELQWRRYYQVMRDTLKRHGLRIDGLAMDSHEAGSQNWTSGFEHQFKKRRGYSLLPFLPAMTGYVVDSHERSDAVLEDVRRTIADLVADEYYGTLDSLCRQDGIPFTAQAIGNALCLVGDPLQAKGRVTKPQGEFWAIHPDGNYDIKESSSAAHLYGKPIASGEAFTDAKFGQPLSYLKQLADGAYCFGINEFVVCASAYQPWTDNRISTGGGRHYCLNRQNSYWHHSHAFWQYQARCSQMMRQGKSVNDLCIYLGENAPVKILTYRLPQLPAGYDWDAFSSDAFFHRMTAQKGRVVLPDGMSYAAIIVPRHTELTEEASQRLLMMERQGVPVWYEHEGQTLADFLLSHNILPDIRTRKTDLQKQNIRFAHRQTSSEDIYFINNHGTEELTDDFFFRTTHPHAQWWDAVTGKRWQLPVSTDGSIRLRLKGKESGFVVWSDTQSDAIPTYNIRQEEQTKMIEGPWTLTIPSAEGKTLQFTLDSLTDWRLSDNTDLRYFSGTATYETTFKYRPTSQQRVLLRFNKLGDLAGITVNGNEVTTVWCSPWEADITDHLRRGRNKLRLDVTNSLINRMIADSQLPESERIINAYPQIVSPTDELQASGIIGPVEIVTVP